MARSSGPTTLLKAAIALEVFLGLGAIGGGAALMLGPRGEILPLPVSALRGSPFGGYLVPGLILFVVIGLGSLGVAAISWRRPSLAPILTLVTGVTLLIWLAVEIAIIGYSNDPPLQPFYIGLGLVILLVGVGSFREASRAA